MFLQACSYNLLLNVFNITTVTIHGQMGVPQSGKGV